MIDVQVLSTVRAKQDQLLLSRAATVALARNRVRHASVSITVVGERRMRRLNRDTLMHDYVTDVLSFDHGDSPEGRLIELVICAPFAAAQARARSLPVAQELARYVIHGCLHCAGFDDSTPRKRAAMWRAQEQAMQRLFGRAYCATS